MATVIDDGWVLPVVGTQVAIFGTSLFVFGGLAKHSFTKLADDEQVAVASKQESMIGPFLSNVHGLAVAYYLFYLGYSISLLFVTDAIHSSINCDVVQIFLFFSFVSAKSVQWVYYTTRLEQMFRDTTHALEDSTYKKLIVSNGSHFVVQMILLVVLFVKTTKLQYASSNGTYQVCSYTAETFDIWTVFVVLFFAVCDTYIMVTVVGGFGSRIFELAAKNNNQEVRSLAFQTGGLLLISTASAYMLSLLSLVYPHNLVCYLGPYLDLTANLVAIFTAQRGVYKNQWLLERQWALEAWGTAKQVSVGREEVGAASPRSTDEQYENDAGAD